MLAELRRGAALEKALLMDFELSLWFVVVLSRVVEVAVAEVVVVVAVATIDLRR